MDKRGIKKNKVSVFVILEGRCCLLLSIKDWMVMMDADETVV
jgi:hypothetical protein